MASVQKWYHHLIDSYSNVVNGSGRSPSTSDLQQDPYGTINTGSFIGISSDGLTCLFTMHINLEDLVVSGDDITIALYVSKSSGSSHSFRIIQNGQYVDSPKVITNNGLNEKTIPYVYFKDTTEGATLDIQYQITGTTLASTDKLYAFCVKTNTVADESIPIQTVDVVSSTNFIVGYNRSDPDAYVTSTSDWGASNITSAWDLNARFKTPTTFNSHRYQTFRVRMISSYQLADVAPTGYVKIVCGSNSKTYDLPTTNVPNSGDIKYDFIVEPDLLTNISDVRVVVHSNSMLYSGQYISWNFLGAEWNVNQGGDYITSVIPPDTPTNLSPLDNYVSNTQYVTFSATLNDSEDPSVGDINSLIVEYSQNSTFSSSVTTIKSNPVSPSNIATVTSNQMINGVWYWRAKSIDFGSLESSYTDVRTLTIANSKPNIPTNLSPTDGYITRTMVKTFSALVSDPYESPVKLEIEYSLTQNFSSSVTLTSSDFVASGTVVNINSNTLINNVTYYWRARAFDGMVYSDYSPVMTLVVNNRIPNLPNSLNPTNNAILTTNSFTITATITDPDNDTVVMEYQVSKVLDFSSILYSGTITGNGSYSQTFSNLPQGNYYWRVRGKDTLGQTSSWTNVRGVFINTPSSGRLSPDYLLEISGATGTITNIQDDPDVPDSNSLVAQGGVNTIARVSFPSPPTGTLKQGNGLQNFRVQVSKTSASTSSGSVIIELYENGTLINSQTFPFTTSPSVFQYSWDASVLSNQTGLNVECKVTGIGIYSGKSSSQFSVSIGAIEWNYQMNSETQVLAPNSYPPNPTITYVDFYKISNEIGIDRSTIKFTFDADVTAWEVRVMGSGQGTGTLADSGGSVTAGTEITAIIDWTELYQEGQNKVNIYGQNATGWTPYQS